MPQKYLPEERAAVQRFVGQLYERSGARSWAAFARQAGVSDLSLNGWKQGREMPGAVNMLRLLAAAGVISSSFDLPEKVSHATPADGSANE